MSGSSVLGQKIALYLVTMLLSLTVHEYAHARVADLLGDDTPRTQGRLTLSPLAHYDMLGTFIIPIVAIIAGGLPLVGWARPVETNPGRYTRRLSMRNGHRLVAVAGPLSNLLLAVLAMAALAVLAPTSTLLVANGGVYMLLMAMVHVNVGLFVLNMLPLPPLDGSRLLPRSLDSFQRSIAPYSFLIILLVLNAPGLREVFYWPVSAIFAALQSVFGRGTGLA